MSDISLPKVRGMKQGRANSCADRLWWRELICRSRVQCSDVGEQDVRRMVHYPAPCREIHQQPDGIPHTKNRQTFIRDPRAELRLDGRLGQGAKRHGEHTLTIRTHTQEEDDNRA